MLKSDQSHSISIVIPALNEESNIGETLTALDSILQGQNSEVLVADGGSCDRTVEITRGFDFARIVFCQQANRGWQMNEGAQKATGEILLFLHADVKMPERAIESVIKVMADEKVSGGCFQIRFPNHVPASLRLVEWGINIRTRLFKTATGDQAIFVRRRIFNEIGGYKTFPLMEDIAMFNELKHRGQIAILDEQVEISPRRWLHYGIWRTVLLMYLLRFGFWLGLNPATLKRFFIDVR